MFCKLSTFILGLVLATSALAQTNNVWVGFSGGTLELICKKVWGMYDTKYNTRTEFFIKPGADGNVAAKDFASSTAPTRSMCTGSSVFVYNQFVYPELMLIVNPVILLSYSPNVWYVPNSSSATTLKELLVELRAVRRPINVGVATSQQKTLIKYFSEYYKIPVNIVSYKSGGQWYPSLTDASLDLAVDTGLGVQVAESGKFKIVGYTSPDNFSRLSGHENFATQNKTLGQLVAWVGIAAPIGADKDQTRLMAEQLHSIVKTSEFRQFAREVFTVDAGLTGIKFEQALSTQIGLVKKHY